MSTNELADVLALLAERLDRLETKVDSLITATTPIDTFRERLPVIADAVATGAQIAWDKAEQAGVDPFAVAEQVERVALKAAHPDAIALVGRVLDHADDLRMLLDKVETLDSRLATIGVTRSELADKAIDVAARVAALAKAPEMTALVDAGPFERETVDVVGRASKALVEVRKQSIKPMGLFATLRAMGDADVQKAIGFALEFARRFGASLR